MGMSYGHTLVPQQIDYQPAPSQVAKFFSALVELGAAPVNPQLQARTHVERRIGPTVRSFFPTLVRAKGSGCHATLPTLAASPRYRLCWKSLMTTI
jgi:hypothetical protein